MTEYLNKRAVLEWIDDRRYKSPWIESFRERLEAGAFDADESEGTWKATAEILGRENAQMNSEVQRLRAALEEIKVFIIDRTQWPYEGVVRNQFELLLHKLEALSTTTEPTGSKINSTRYIVRRDQYGYAEAIERDGYTVLHLQPGTERNEQEVEGIVALLNMNAAKVERVREYYRKLEELRNRTKYRDAAIEYEQRITDICNVLDFLGITIPGINAPEGDENE